MHGQFNTISSPQQVNDLNLTNMQYTGSQEMSLGNYTNMYFDRDSHFFDLEVNTTHSSVHVPTNGNYLVKRHCSG